MKTADDLIKKWDRIRANYGVIEISEPYLATFRNRVEAIIASGAIENEGSNNQFIGVKGGL